MNAASIPTSAPIPIPDFWTGAVMMFARMRRVIGAARWVRTQHYDAKGLRKLRRWLNPLEALVRRIIFLEAHALALEPAPPCKPAPARNTEAAAPRPRRYVFRLWPRPRPHPARIRMLGRPILVREIWRENKRRALAERLKAARVNRTPAPQRIAERMQALARIILKPTPAIRRLARKLRRASRPFKFKLAFSRWPRSPHLDETIKVRIYNAAWSALERDTS